MYNFKFLFKRLTINKYAIKIKIHNLILLRIKNEL